MTATLETVLKIIKDNELEIRNFGVNEVYIFGSVVRNEAKDESDIDIFVVLDSKAKVGLIKFISLQNFLSLKLGKKVDLASKAALHPLLKEQILKEAVRAA